LQMYKVELCSTLYKNFGCLTRLEYPKWGMPLESFLNIQTASKIAVLCLFCTTESSLSGEPAPKMYKVEL